MENGFAIFCIIIGFVAISFHCTGAGFLLKTTSSFTENVELLSLSLASSIYYSLANMDIIIRLTFKEPFGDFTRYKYIVIFGHTLLIPLFSAMIFLTVQRFFAVWYHLRYETSWVFRKRTYLIAGSWMLAGVLFLVISFIDVLQGEKSNVWLHYIYNVTVIGLMVTNLSFLAVYSYIYYKYHQTRRQNASQSSFYENRKAKFFTPFLVCFSFFVFGTVPMLFNSVGVNVDVNIMILGSFLDGVCNSLVYVFLNERFVSWFRRWKSNNRLSQNTT